MRRQNQIRLCIMQSGNYRLLFGTVTDAARFFFDVTSLNSGIYFCKITDEKNIYAKKFVVDHTRK